MDRDDVDISVSGQNLTIKGEKTHEDEKKESDYYHTEMWRGAFQRTISLPDFVDADKATANVGKPGKHPRVFSCLDVLVG